MQFVNDSDCLGCRNDMIVFIMNCASDAATVMSLHVCAEPVISCYVSVLSVLLTANLSCIYAVYYAKMLFDRFMQPQLEIISTAKAPTGSKWQGQLWQSVYAYFVDGKIIFVTAR